MRFYVSLFDDAEVLEISRYGPGEQGPEGTVRQAVFSLAGEPLVHRQSRQARLRVHPGGFSEKFGWINDRFGVSWQLTLPSRAQQTQSAT